MKNIKNMIRSLLRWARTTKTGDDAGNFPVQQVGYLGKVGDSVMWFPYGMHANIPVDELVLMVSMQGNPEARVSIPGSPQKRVKPLAASEVVFFHPDTGSKLHFKANGDIEISSQKDVNVLVAGNALVDVEGNLTADVEGNADVDVAGNADVDVVGTADVDSVGAMAITAPTLLITSDVTITGDYTQTGDADVGIGGEVGLGGIFADGDNVARKGDTVDELTGDDIILEGSTKVRAVGPAG